MEFLAQEFLILTHLLTSRWLLDSSHHILHMLHSFYPMVSTGLAVSFASL